MNRPVRRALLPFLLLVAAGCGLLRRPPPAVDRSQDLRIREEVLARVAAEPALDPAQIRVEVDGGVVVLYGSVAGISAWQCAILNAQLVAGVRSVTDFLVLEPGPREIVCFASRVG
jgi:osmotically-inducible protein OsmY